MRHHVPHVARHVLVVAALSATSLVAALGVARVLDASPRVVVQDGAHPREVVGLWTRWPGAQQDGDRVRFYFFHESGIGLYRFGKIGMNTTQSFDWRVEAAGERRELVLTFRKTGEVKRTPFSLAGERRALVMTKDPKEPLVGAISYTYVPPPALAAFAPDLALDGAAGEQGAGIGGRMWIDEVSFATGGKAFSMYQLKDTAIDGRGVGWHHVGDYDDWSTEALQYRYSAASCRSDPHLQLHFTVRDERAQTPVVRGPKNELVLVEDPRSYWHVRSYKDGGRSFSFLR